MYLPGKCHSFFEPGRRLLTAYLVTKVQGDHLGLHSDVIEDGGPGLSCHKRYCGSKAVCNLRPGLKTFEKHRCVFGKNVTEDGGPAYLVTKLQKIL